MLEKDSSVKVKHVRVRVPLPCIKWVLYPYSSFCLVQCSLWSPWAGIIGMRREVQHLLWVSTWDHHQWGHSTPLI